MTGIGYLALLTVGLLSLNLEAKTFQNSYISFELPEHWSCLQEGVAWSCSSTKASESKEAIIVIAAKVSNPEENLDFFLSYLAKPKSLVSQVGTPLPSQVMYAQRRLLAGHNWIQAQHLGSEIPDFYTLYLATIKNQLAILVSFSAEKNRYKVYNSIFDQAMKTLKIVASQELLMAKAKMRPAGEVIGIEVTEPLDPKALLPPPESVPTKKSNLLLYLLLLLGIGLAIVGFLKFREKPARTIKKRSK